MSIKSDTLFGIIENAKDAGADLIYTDIPEKTSRVFRWIATNPEKALAIAGLVVSFLRASQSLIVTQRVRSEQLRQDYRYYDPNNHIHWDLCRKLNNHDKEEILRRCKNGESVYDILRSINAIR